MAVSYNKLWKLMIDKKINKSQLCKKIKISSSTMAKMTNEEMVAMTVLEKIQQFTTKNKRRHRQKTTFYYNFIKRVCKRSVKSREDEKDGF